MSRQNICTVQLDKYFLALSFYNLPLDGCREFQLTDHFSWWDVGCIRVLGHQRKGKVCQWFSCSPKYSPVGCSVAHVPSPEEKKCQKNYWYAFDFTNWRLVPKPTPVVELKVFDAMAVHLWYTSWNSSAMAFRIWFGYIKQHQGRYKSLP